MPENGESLAFGFFDPSLVVCGCHLILAFVDGCTNQCLCGGPSVARLPSESENWARYYTEQQNCCNV